MFTVTSEIQNRFFDRQSVIESIGRANARRLGRMGAFIRTRARSSLRPAGKSRRSAAPGRPPRVHSNSATVTLKNIQFGLQSDDAGVVIGPVKLNQNNRFAQSSMTVPELLEFGGPALIREYRWPNTDVWIPGAPRRKRDRDEVEQRFRAARFFPHPFMGPALEKEIAKGTVADVWSTSIGS